jgi:hypothetical protein
MVTEFHNQEAEYARFLAGGGGFVCNGLDMGPEWRRLHRSDCVMLHRAGPASYGLHTSVKKAGSRSLSDLIRWLEERFGAEGDGFSYCAFCFRDL